MRAARLFAAGLGACAAALSAAEPIDPIEWLLKASESARHVSYQGIVVYRDQEKMETLRIVHRHKDGREQERLTSLSGAPRDVVRDDDHADCRGSHGGKAVEARQNLLPALSAQTVQQVAQHYAFESLDEARVAGRSSLGVRIVPRDEYRYGYEVWADRATAVPLKVSLVDRKGRVIEQMLYTEVEFPQSIPDRAFAHAGIDRREPDASRAVPTPVSHAPAPRAWSVAKLPPGFREVMRGTKPAVDGEGPVEHVLLSDGLSAVSVFAVRVEPNHQPFRGFSHLGAMNAYGRALGAYHVTVVGEVPQAAVRLIGDGLSVQDR